MTGPRPKRRPPFFLKDRRPIAPIPGGAPVKRWTDMTEDERDAVRKTASKPP